MKRSLNDLFLFLYLDPVDVNGDEYQNIEISSENISISADRSSSNNGVNNQQQNLNDSKQSSKLNFFLFCFRKFFFLSSSDRESKSARFIKFRQ